MHGTSDILCYATDLFLCALFETPIQAMPRHDRYYKQDMLAFGNTSYTSAQSRSFDFDIWHNFSLGFLRGYCTPGQFLDCFCIFLKNYNTLVTSKICFL